MQPAMANCCDCSALSPRVWRRNRVLCCAPPHYATHIYSVTSIGFYSKLAILETQADKMFVTLLLPLLTILIHITHAFSSSSPTPQAYPGLDFVFTKPCRNLDPIYN